MSIELRRARNRQMLIFLLVCVGMVALIGRLYFWQVVRGYGAADCTHGYGLAKCANLEHIQNQQLNAPRGLIYDAQGHILATNVFVKTPHGWRIVAHHASVAPGKAQYEAPKVTLLH